MDTFPSGPRAGFLCPTPAHGARLLQAGFGLPIDDARFVTKAGGLAIPEFCEPAHSKRLAQRFRNLTVEVPYWTACGETLWLDELHRERVAVLLTLAFSAFHQSAWCTIIIIAFSAFHLVTT